MIDFENRLHTEFQVNCSIIQPDTLAVRLVANRGERGNPTRKDNAAHIVSHELETRRLVSLLLPLCVSVPKLYSISREA